MGVKMCNFLATLLAWALTAWLQVFPLVVVMDAYRNYARGNTFPYPCWFSFGRESTSWLCPVWCWYWPRTITWTFAALEVKPVLVG